MLLEWTSIIILTSLMIHSNALLCYSGYTIIDPFMILGNNKHQVRLLSPADGNKQWENHVLKYFDRQVVASTPG